MVKLDVGLVAATFGLAVVKAMSLLGVLVELDVDIALSVEKTAVKAMSLLGAVIELNVDLEVVVASVDVADVETTFVLKLELDVNLVVSSVKMTFIDAAMFSFVELMIEASLNVKLLLLAVVESGVTLVVGVVKEVGISSRKASKVEITSNVKVESVLTAKNSDINCEAGSLSVVTSSSCEST